MFSLLGDANTNMCRVIGTSEVIEKIVTTVMKWSHSGALGVRDDQFSAWDSGTSDFLGLISRTPDFPNTFGNWSQVLWSLCLQHEKRLSVLEIFKCFNKGLKQYKVLNVFYFHSSKFCNEIPRAIWSIRRLHLKHELWLDGSLNGWF